MRTFLKSDRKGQSDRKKIDCITSFRERETEYIITGTKEFNF